MQRHRITTAVYKDGDREVTVTFQPDGIHLHERYGRKDQDRIITLKQLVCGNGNEPMAKQVDPRAVDPRYAKGSLSETLELSACDLCVLADKVHSNDYNKKALGEVKASSLAALKIIRGLEIIAPT